MFITFNICYVKVYWIKWIVIILLPAALPDNERVFFKPSLGDRSASPASHRPSKAAGIHTFIASWVAKQVDSGFGTKVVYKYLSKSHKNAFAPRAMPPVFRTPSHGFLSLILSLSFSPSQKKQNAARSSSYQVPTSALQCTLQPEEEVVLLFREPKFKKMRVTLPSSSKAGSTRGSTYNT